MVEQLFVAGDPHRTNFDGLYYAGARPLPFLLKALDDPRTSTMVFTGKDVPVMDGSPFERICTLLRHLRPPEAAKPLAHYLDSPNESFREEAALVLASIGTQEGIEPVKRALADKGIRVREYALIGLTSEATRQRLDERFRSGVFPALLPLLDAKNYSGRSPAKAMMAMDASRSAPILESPQYFSVHNSQLTEIAEALDRKDVKVPRKLLLAVLAELGPLATEKSREQVTYAAALGLYANNPDGHAESQFTSLLDSRSTIVSDAAARGLETLAGINHSIALNLYDDRGFDAMTKPQQFCFAVELYRDEVNNGGHRQYFYNDDSDLYQVALEGMRAIGADTQATILSDAALAFAPDKPAPTETERRHQMEALGTDMDAKFQTADSRFYKLEEEPGRRLNVLLTMYALKHRGDFADGLSSADQAGKDPERGR